MKRSAGFTLIELMIVVAIIATIAAIAIPNLLRSRINSNEAAAVGNMRTISIAEVSYFGLHKVYGDFAALTGDDDPPCLVGNWAGAAKNGYNFALAVDATVGYTLTATPVDDSTGRRVFYTDASGVVHLDDATGPPIDE